MAAISGNVVTLKVGKQTAKGTPQATPTLGLKLTGGDLVPARTTIQLAETDATRQQGQTVVVGAVGAQGSPSFYLRPDDFAFFAYMALGANADSGTTPNFTHTATPANSGPYFTAFKAIGSTILVDRYEDIRVTGLHVAGGQGGALTYTVDCYGLNATLGQTDPVLAVVTQTPLVYPQVTVTKGGSAPGTIESFNLDIVNGGSALQGDKQINPYEYVWGELAVSGTITMLFESDADWRAFHTGSTSGTTLSTTLYTQTMDILAQANANLSVRFTMSSVAYDSVTVPPDPGGAPIRSVLGFRSMPDPTIGNYISIVVKNQIATAA